MSKGRNIAIFSVTTITTFAILAIIRAISFTSEPPALEGGLMATPITQNGKETLVPSQYILNTGIDPQDIPPIVNPVYSSVLGADTYLNDTATGVVAEIDGIVHFYPTQILNYHYVVRGNSQGGAFALTYCPLCQSAALYETQKQLFATQYVYNNNVILGDEAGNKWNQLTGTAIEGPEIGQTLKRKDGLQLLTWLQFKELYPSGLVLSENTGFNREYGVHPFGAYPVNDRVYYPLSYASPDSENKPKQMVAGIPEKGIAIPIRNEKNTLTNFGSGPNAVLAVYDGKGVLHLLSPYLENQMLNFTFDKNGEVITDAETRSTWSVYGVAESGPMTGKRLAEIPYMRAFSMCWLGMYPESKIVLE